MNVTNTGAAFGSFKNNNAFFIALSCIALVAVRFRFSGENSHPGCLARCLTRACSSPASWAI